MLNDTDVPDGSSSVDQRAIDENESSGYLKMSGNEDHHRQSRRFAAGGNGHDGRDPRDVEIERLRQRANTSILASNLKVHINTDVPDGSSPVDQRAIDENEAGGLSG
nr:reverse transcriptase domain-containing protein [Tanacetum cinerariifolium]